MRDPLRTQIDQTVRQLDAGAQRWAASSLAERAALLRATHEAIGSCAAAWTGAAVVAKGGPDRWLVAEEWLSGPYATLGGFLGMAASLEALGRGISPAAGLRAARAPGGRTTLQVLPTNRQEQLLLNGFRADVWLRPGVTLEAARAGAGLGALRSGVSGGVAVVLGAGNVSAIGPLDVLSQLVAGNRASVLKVNPTFESLVPVYRRALAPLIEADLLDVRSGDATLGEALVHHPGVAHVHLTGSRRTHDAIVWGDNERGEPALTASVSSELGGVSPCIIVPGSWSRADLRYQAERVVTQRMHNAGHNCIGTQVLVLSSDWSQRREFLDEVRRVLDELPRREVWYPDATTAMTTLHQRHPGAEQHGGCTLIELAATESDALFDTEFFGPALAYTTMPGTGSVFLRSAVRFANDRLDGTLGAGIIVAPESRRALGPAFDEAVAGLRYGAVGINVWTGFIFDLAGAPWGAYPGGTLAEPGSGIGVVHNAYLLSDTERTVAEGPFRPFPRSVIGGELSLSPRPPWFVTARTARETSKRMTEYAADPTWPHLLSVLPAAFRG